MSSGRFRNGASALHQRGFALIAMLVLAAMITAYLISIGLNQSRAELSNEREERNMSALRQAKAALIAYAADTEGWQAFKGLANNQPGALPCPTILVDNGSADCAGPGISPNTSLIGRLPWQHVGVEDLRDASGERLWYALSYNFRKNFGTTIINSDTSGQLTVNGTAPASQAVAVVFASGTTLLGQTRPSDPANAAHNSPTNYLEGFDIITDTVNFKFTSNQSSDTFNDRVLVITQAELMAAVEPVVAARIERTVKPILNTYKSQWGAFPFPSKFDLGPPPPPPPGTGPGTSGSASTRSSWTYLGDPSITGGLLPVAYLEVSGASNASPILVTTSSAHTLVTGDTVWIFGVGGNTAANNKWTVTVVDSTHFQLNGSTGSGGYTSGGLVTRSYPWSNWSVTRVGGVGQIVNEDCPSVGMPTFAGLQCTFRARDDSCAPGNCITDLRVRISAEVGQNAGRTLAALPALSNVVTVEGGTPRVFTSDSLTGSLDVNGVGTVTYTATLPAAINCTNTCVNHDYTVTIPDVVLNAAISASDPNVGWFLGNEWYRQTYYAVSQEFLPGKSGTCNPLPAPPAPAPVKPCLRVDNLPAPAAGPAPTPDNKQAILVLAGRAFNGGRPSADLTKYFEKANLAAATGTVPFAYQHRSGVPTDINDRVIVLSP